MKRACWFLASSSAAVGLVLSLFVGLAAGTTVGKQDSENYPVVSTTIVFSDHTRTTPASNGSPAEPYRSLSTLIVYPAHSSDHHGQFPLICVFPWLWGQRGQPTPTLDALASHGYVVAALDFPLSTTGLPGGLDLLDYKSQPGDVSYVITQMLKQNGLHSSPVYREIEPHRVGVFGHSLGAVTTLAVTYNSCCRDSRIGAAVEMDGELNVPIGPSGQFPGSYFKGKNAPLLMINGTKDTISPYPISQALYARAPSPKFLLSLIGAPHEGFAMTPWFATVNNTVAAFFERYLGSGRTVEQIKNDGNQSPTVKLQASAN